MSSTPSDDLSRLHYIDARDLGVRGKPFEATERFFARLPASMKDRPTQAVWNLAQMSTGFFVDFDTDSPSLAAELSLESDWEQRPDLHAGTVNAYCHDGLRWGYVGVLRDLQLPTTHGFIARGLVPQRRRYRVYLPHAAPVASLHIGIEPGCVLEPAEPERLKPILCYGTSIVHGFSASRPGMTMPAQLGRRLGREVWNQGFSGNARMEIDLADAYGTLDPAVVCIDCLPNMQPEQVRERTGPFVRRLREQLPTTPILLVENIVYQATYMLADRRGGWGPKNDALLHEFRRLQEDGVEHLHYLKGEQLLGSDGEATSDGTHPSDLGMVRLTDAYEAALRPLL